MRSDDLSVTARLTSDDLAQLRAACALSGTNVHAWCRHIVFGLPLPPTQHADDVAARHSLSRIGSLLLIVRDLVVRSSLDAAARDRTVARLDDIAEVVLVTNAALAQPYVRTVLAPTASCVVRGAHPLRIRCPDQQRFDAVGDATAACGLSVAAWLGSVIVAGGLPQPVRPHATAAGRKLLAAVTIVLTECAKHRDAAVISDMIAAQGESLAFSVRAAVEQPGATP